MNKQEIEFMIGTAENTVKALTAFALSGHGEITINEALKASEDGLDNLERMLNKMNGGK